jgi:hypothetical protein
LVITYSTKERATHDHRKTQFRFGEVQAVRHR